MWWPIPDRACTLQSQYPCGDSRNSQDSQGLWQAHGHGSPHHDSHDVRTDSQSVRTLQSQYPCGDSRNSQDSQDGGRHNAHSHAMLAPSTAYPCRIFCRPACTFIPRMGHKGAARRVNPVLGGRSPVDRSPRCRRGSMTTCRAADVKALAALSSEPRTSRLIQAHKWSVAALAGEWQAQFARG